MSVIPERIMKRRSITDGGCWEWTGCRRNGYGRVWVDGRLVTVHRYVAHLTLGLDLADKSLCACHRCDNPSCFNPDHLFVGTHADNVRDMNVKGRRGVQPERATIHARRRACDSCGREYTPQPSHRGRSRVCSRDCLLALRSTMRAGKGFKLDAETVAQLRGDLDEGLVSGVELARRYGISPAMVSLIKSRKVWAND